MFKDLTESGKLQAVFNSNSVIAFNGKEFHIISSETYSNVFSRHKHMCSKFGLKRICILYFDSDFFFIHHVQQPNEMLGTGLDGIHFYKQSG